MLLGALWIILALVALKGCGSGTRTVAYPSAEGKGLLEIDTVHVIDPPSGVHERTVIFLQGMQAIVREQYNMLSSKGFLADMDANVRVVAPQIAKTARNKLPHWFPFHQDPWSHTLQSLTSVFELNWSMNVLMPIVEAEAAKLGGDFSKVFIVGYSQGAMMGIWTGLMANRPFGGVIAYSGCLPVFTLDQVSVLGRKVPVVHFHDRRDKVVLFEHALRGLKVAQQAGAKGYKSVTEVAINGDTHHGLSGPTIKLVNQELAIMMQAEPLI